MNTRDIRRLIQSRITKRRVKFKAVLGKADGTFKSSEPFAGENDVYVTLFNGEAMTVYNGRIPNMTAIVDVGYDDDRPGMLQVLGFAPEYRNKSAPSIKNHAASHRWFDYDPVDVYRQAFMELLPRSLGGLKVRIYTGVYACGGLFHILPNTDVDLSGEAVSSGAEWVNVEVDADGVISFTHGDNYDNRFQLTPENVPTTSSSKKLLCSVKMYNGQTSVIETRTDSDIFDPRFSTGGRLGGMRYVGEWDASETYSTGDVVSVTDIYGDPSLYLCINESTNNQPPNSTYWIPMASGGGGSAAWGAITGTLSDQTDLKNALNDKLDDTLPDGNRVVITNSSGTIGTYSKLQYDQTDNVLLQGSDTPLFGGSEINAFELIGEDNDAGNIIAAYGTGSTAFLTFLFGNGTKSSPTHVKNNDVLGTIRARGHDGDGAGHITPSRGYIQFVADGDWSTSSTPVRVDCYVTPTSSATPALAMTLKSNGELDVNTHRIKNVVDPTDDQDAATKKYIDDKNITSGTWTPTGTKGTNVSSMTTSQMNYIRIGNQVMFNGLAVIKNTVIGVFTCYLTIPIASNFTDYMDANGNGTQPGAGGGNNIISIREDQTNNRLQLDGYTYKSGVDVYYRLVGGYIIK